MGGEQAASVLAQIRQEAKTKKGESVRESSLAMINIHIRIY
jgi:hypothetical protein